MIRFNTNLKNTLGIFLILTFWYHNVDGTVSPTSHRSFDFRNFGFNKILDIREEDMMRYYAIGEISNPLRFVLVAHSRHARDGPYYRYIGTTANSDDLFRYYNSGIIKHELKMFVLNQFSLFNRTVALNEIGLILHYTPSSSNPSFNSIIRYLMKITQPSSDHVHILYTPIYQNPNIMYIAMQKSPESVPLVFEPKINFVNEPHTTALIYNKNDNLFVATRKITQINGVTASQSNSSRTLVTSINSHVFKCFSPRIIELKILMGLIETQRRFVRDRIVTSPCPLSINESIIIRDISNDECIQRRINYLDLSEDMRLKIKIKLSKNECERLINTTVMEEFFVAESQNGSILANLFQNNTDTYVNVLGYDPNVFWSNDVAFSDIGNPAITSLERSLDENFVRDYFLEKTLRKLNLNVPTLLKVPVDRARYEPDVMDHGILKVLQYIISPKIQ